MDDWDPAILDRLLDHSHALLIQGDSYSAGLTQPDRLDVANGRLIYPIS
jgi:hypothetical protein